MDGDSGSWVVNEKTLEVYGYVVAADAFGGGYIVPLDDALRDIADKLQAQSVELATIIDMATAKLRTITILDPSAPSFVPTQQTQRRSSLSEHLELERARRRVENERDRDHDSHRRSYAAPGPEDIRLQRRSVLDFTAYGTSPLHHPAAYAHYSRAQCTSSPCVDLGCTDHWASYRRPRQQVTNGEPHSHGSSVDPLGAPGPSRHSGRSSWYGPMRHGHYSGNVIEIRPRTSVPAPGAPPRESVVVFDVGYYHDDSGYNTGAATTSNRSSCSSTQSSTRSSPGQSLEASTASSAYASRHSSRPNSHSTHTFFDAASGAATSPPFQRQRHWR